MIKACRFRSPADKNSLQSASIPHELSFYSEYPQIIHCPEREKGVWTVASGTTNAPLNKNVLMV